MVIKQNLCVCIINNDKWWKAKHNRWTIPSPLWVSRREWWRIADLKQSDIPQSVSQSVSTNKLSVSYVKRNRLISVEEKIKSHSSPPLHRIIILLPPAAMVLNEWKLPIHTHTSLLPQSVSHCGAYHWRLLLLFLFPNRTVERWRKIIIILRR